MNKRGNGNLHIPHKLNKHLICSAIRIKNKYKQKVGLKLLILMKVIRMTASVTNVCKCYKIKFM